MHEDYNILAASHLFHPGYQRILKNELGWPSLDVKITSPWTNGPPVPPVETGAIDSKMHDLPMSPGELSTDDEKDLSGADAEGVWSPDIEQSFQEALAIYPPCGRRKIILSDEGKMYGFATGINIVSTERNIMPRMNPTNHVTEIRGYYAYHAPERGRNELIARYIKLRTGKTRTRKQVSSHIQVLARRKLREIQAKLKNSSKDEVLRLYGSFGQLYGLSPQDQAAKEKALQSMSSMSSAQIVSAAAALKGPSLSGLGIPSSYAPTFWQPGLQPGPSQDVKPFAQSHYPGPPPGSAMKGPPSLSHSGPTDMALLGPPPNTTPTPPWEGRAIATHKLRMVEFSAFIEQERAAETYHKHLFVHIGPASYSDPLLESVDIRQIQDKFPEKKGGLKELHDKGPQDAFFLVKFWADLNNIEDDHNGFYAVTSLYESPENMTITCSTKVCSFGKQVVEKVETEYAHFENGRFVYRINRSPMCEYMINFINKLKSLPEKYMMNSVLENFTILQVVTNRDTQETLLCIAYVFEVSSSEHGAQHHLYRLLKE